MEIDKLTHFVYRLKKSSFHLALSYLSNAAIH